MKIRLIGLLALALLSCNNGDNTTDPFSTKDENNDHGLGTLYSAVNVTGGGYLYYYLMPDGRIMKGCPLGGLEKFDFDKYYEQNQIECGRYEMDDNSIIIKWNDGNEQTGKLLEGGFELNYATYSKALKVNPKLSATYSNSKSFSGGLSINSTTFHEDGTLINQINSGFDNNDSKWSAESESQLNGTYEIRGYTITIEYENGETGSHTIYTFDEAENPDFLGWDNTFLAKQL